MIRIALAALCLASSPALSGTSALAEPCAQTGDIVGTARVLEVDTRGGLELGTMQYAQTAELEPGEIILTFDDGPNPQNTPQILDILDTHCVKATFFVVGRYVEQHPELLREIWQRGHAIANHSWGHPHMHRQSGAAGQHEIERADAAIAAALDGLVDENGNPARAEPFFRFPGLNHTSALRQYLAQTDRAVISCDIGTDDWRRISPASVQARALRNIESLGSGIVIMHDTQARTVAALPGLLDQLAERNYRAVQLRARHPE